MTRRALFAVCMGFAIVLAGCTGQPVAEEDLPTRVPQLDAQVLLAAAKTARPTARPTATNTPIPPTPTPGSIAVPESAVVGYGDVEISDSVEVTDTSELTDTTAPTDIGAIDASSPITDAATTQDAEDQPQTEGTEPATTDSADGDDASEAEVKDVDPLFAGMPDSLVAAMAGADPYNGETLTLSTGCTGCHSLDPNQFMAGPTWYDLAAVAAGRVEGQSAGLYLYTSIIEPNAYVVEDYQPNIMLQIYNETIPEDDLADIIAYLLTIRGR